MNIDGRVCAVTATALLGCMGVAAAAPADDLERIMHKLVKGHSFC